MNPEINTMTPLSGTQIPTQPLKAYAIKRWSQVYENAQTRRLKTMGYSILPRQLDSLEYRMILQCSDGFAILTVWQALLQVAITCPQRGLLVTGGGPLRARELAAMTHIPEPVVDSALEALESPDIGWLHQVECPKHLLVGGSLRYGRKGRPTNPGFVMVEGVESGPGVYIEWEYTLVDHGEGPDVERVLPPAIKKFLEPKPAKPEGVEVSIRNLSLHARDMGTPVDVHAPPDPQNTPSKPKPPSGMPLATTLQHLVPSVDVHTLANKMKHYPSTTIDNMDHRCEIGEMLERLTFSREGAYAASSLNPLEIIDLRSRIIPCAVDQALPLGMSREDLFYFVMGVICMEDLGLLLKTG